MVVEVREGATRSRGRVQPAERAARSVGGEHVQLRAPIGGSVGVAALSMPLDAIHTIHVTRIEAPHGVAAACSWTMFEPGEKHNNGV